MADAATEDTRKKARGTYIAVTKLLAGTCKPSVRQRFVHNAYLTSAPMADGALSRESVPTIILQTQTATNILTQKLNNFLGEVTKPSTRVSTQSLCPLLPRIL